MRRSGGIVVAAGAALVAGLAFGLGSGLIPLGIPGDWEWQRVRVGVSGRAVALALVGVIAYSAFVARGLKAMTGPIGVGREALWLSILVGASVGVQVIVQEGAPEGFGLSKWIFALHAPGSSGYYTVAKDQMADPWRFLADYPAWISRQDALHVGTHPPASSWWPEGSSAQWKLIPRPHERSPTGPPLRSRWRFRPSAKGRTSLGPMGRRWP